MIIIKMMMNVDQLLITFTPLIIDYDLTFWQALVKRYERVSFPTRGEDPAGFLRYEMVGSMLSASSQGKSVFWSFFF